MELRVFVVDDEESIRDTFKWLIEDIGYEAIAVNYPQFCKDLSSPRCDSPVRCCDALFIDYNLKLINGLDFLTRLSEKKCKIPSENIFLISGDITKINTDNVDMIGCKVMQKPILLSKLRRIIECIN